MQQLAERHMFSQALTPFSFITIVIDWALKMNRGKHVRLLVFLTNMDKYLVPDDNISVAVEIFFLFSIPFSPFWPRLLPDAISKTPTNRAFWKQHHSTGVRLTART